MRETEQFRLAYNAHEWAEQAALGGIYVSLQQQSIEALACLADPEWGWATRGFLSDMITEAASEVLDEKLEALVAL